MSIGNNVYKVNDLFVENNRLQLVTRVTNAWIHTVDLGTNDCSFRVKSWLTGKPIVWGVKVTGWYKLWLQLKYDTLSIIFDSKD